MAKPKQEKINTTHFVQKCDVISIHEDSADNDKYRFMNNFEMAGSLFLKQGNQFVDSWERDIAILPMENNCEGFSSEVFQSGALVNMPSEGFVLLALGSWGEWIEKKKKQNQE